MLCDVFSLRHRMTRCVLSPAQVAAQAVKVKKVDQHPLPPPEEVVHAVDEAAHHHPPHTVEEAAHQHPLHAVQVSHSLPGSDVVCDGLFVNEGQEEPGVSVFLLSHIIPRRFFPQLLRPSLSYLGKPLPLLLLCPSKIKQYQYKPCPTTLLHIPQPSLPMVRARTPTVWSLFPPRQCESSFPDESSAVECQSVGSQ
jgi:hypothetical protein